MHTSYFYPVLHLKGLKKFFFYLVRYIYKKFFLFFWPYFKLVKLYLHCIALLTFILLTLIGWRLDFLSPNSFNRRSRIFKIQYILPYFSFFPIKKLSKFKKTCKFQEIQPRCPLTRPADLSFDRRVSQHQKWNRKRGLFSIYPNRCWKYKRSEGLGSS